MKGLFILDFGLSAGLFQTMPVRAKDAMLNLDAAEFPLIMQVVV